MNDASLKSRTLRRLSRVYTTSSELTTARRALLYRGEKNMRSVDYFLFHRLSSPHGHYGKGKPAWLGRGGVTG